MSHHVTVREVGTLTSADLGKSVRVEDEGWVHDGTLAEVQHMSPLWPGKGSRVYVIVVYPSGARKFIAVDADHEIEVASEDEERPQ